MKRRAELSRRRFLAGAFGATGALALGGCDALSQTKWAPKILEAGEKLSSVTQHLIAPRRAMAQEFNEKAVEEFAKYFIGRPNGWTELVKRSVLVKPTSAPMPPRPKAKTEPQYLIHKDPEPAPAEEKKGGLFGSLKSLIKKD